MRYNTEVLYVGKRHISTDALSRAPSSTPVASHIQFIEEVETVASCTKDNLPSSAQRLQVLKDAKSNEE